MRELRAPEIQAKVDAYSKEIRRIQKELYEDYERKLNQRTGHIVEALTKLYSENPVVEVELTPQEQIELEEMKNEN